MSKKPGMGRRPEVREWLIDLRGQKGMTQGAVAAAAGIAQPSYYEIEKGLSRPKPDTAKKLGEVLGFDWTRFYEEAEEGERCGDM